MNEILENFLWLGDRFAASDTKVLKKLGITHLLTLYGTHEHEYELPVKARCIPLDDSGMTDLGSIFNRCFEFIDDAKVNGKILVHCAAGVNRSPSIVVAYLMKNHRMRFHEAYEFVQEKRYCIQPAPSYRMQLLEYDKILYEEKRTSTVTEDPSTQRSSSGFNIANIFSFWFSSNTLARPILF